MKKCFAICLCSVLLYGITAVSAQSGAALNFDGVKDYVGIPHNSLLKPATGITIELWIKATDLHTNPYCEIYRKEDGLQRHVFSFTNYGTVLFFGLEVGTSYSELRLTAVPSDYEGKWVHLAATFDGFAKRVYRNGNLIGTEPVTGLIGTTGTALITLGAFDANTALFKGSMDEFRVWNRALSQAEIQNTMNCGFSIQQTGLLLYYNFNQGLGGGPNPGLTTLYDSSGNNFNAKLNKFDLNGPVSNWVVDGAITSTSACAHPLYTFVGNGNWSLSSNWSNGTMPPAVLPAGSEIVVDPPANGKCILDRPQTILPGGNFTVKPGKQFEVKGNLVITTLPGITTTPVSSVTKTSAISGGTITKDGGTPVKARGICWGTSPTINLADNKTVNGTGIGNFTSSMTGLLPATVYFVKAYVINSVDTAYGNELSFKTQDNVSDDVRIGDQTWQVKNLEVTKYRNGDIIPEVTDMNLWSGLTTGAWCYYNNDPANGAIYGKLYNWAAVTDPRGLAPSGWHIPSDSEWTVLVDTLGSEQVAGDKMKSLALWQTYPGASPSNSSGFTGLPAGFRDPNGLFLFISSYTYWWSTTPASENNAWDRDLYYGYPRVVKYANYKKAGLSVRCIKD